MHALLESLRQDYRRIILDSPPLWAATDAAVLTSFVDGTLLVVKAGDTKRNFAQRAVKLLGDLNAKILGVVLNKMDVRQGRLLLLRLLLLSIRPVLPG